MFKTSQVPLFTLIIPEKHKMSHLLGIYFKCTSNTIVFDSYRCLFLNLFLKMDTDEAIVIQMASGYRHLTPSHLLNALRKSKALSLRETFRWESTALLCSTRPLKGYVNPCSISPTFKSSTSGPRKAEKRLRSELFAVAAECLVRRPEASLCSLSL